MLAGAAPSSASAAPRSQDKSASGCTWCAYWPATSSFSKTFKLPNEFSSLVSVACVRASLLLCPGVARASLDLLLPPVPFEARFAASFRCLPPPPLELMCCAAPGGLVLGDCGGEAPSLCTPTAVAAPAPASAERRSRISVPDTRSLFQPRRKRNASSAIGLATSDASRSPSAISSWNDHSSSPASTAMPAVAIPAV